MHYVFEKWISEVTSHFFVYVFFWVKSQCPFWARKVFAVVIIIDDMWHRVVWCVKTDSSRGMLPQVAKSKRFIRRPWIGKLKKLNFLPDYMVTPETSKLVSFFLTNTQSSLVYAAIFCAPIYFFNFCVYFTSVWYSCQSSYGIRLESLEFMIHKKMLKCHESEEKHIRLLFWETSFNVAHSGVCVWTPNLRNSTQFPQPVIHLSSCLLFHL